MSGSNPCFQHPLFNPDEAPYPEDWRGAVPCISSYLMKLFAQPELLVEEATLFLRSTPELRSVDTLIGRGMSGSLAVALLGAATGLCWAVVRKRGEVTHSSYEVEGRIGARWLFVDDFMSSGTTLRKTYAAVQEHLRDYIPHKTEFAGRSCTSTCGTSQQTCFSWP